VIFGMKLSDYSFN